MPKITAAHAYANNEVAYVAWDTDGTIPGCLGFEVTRIHLNADGSVAERVRCAAWVAFKGQKNPRWLPQDTKSASIFLITDTLGSAKSALWLRASPFRSTIATAFVRS